MGTQNNSKQFVLWKMADFEPSKSLKKQFETLEFLTKRTPRVVYRCDHNKMYTVIASMIFRNRYYCAKGVGSDKNTATNIALSCVERQILQDKSRQITLRKKIHPRTASAYFAGNSESDIHVFTQDDVEPASEAGTVLANRMLL
jgi:hypothetical protein